MICPWKSKDVGFRDLSAGLSNSLLGPSVPGFASPTEDQLQHHASESEGQDILFRYAECYGDNYKSSQKVQIHLEFLVRP